MQYYKSIKMEQGMQDENIDETNQMQMIPVGMYIEHPSIINTDKGQM